MGTSLLLYISYLHFQFVLSENKLQEPVPLIQVPHYVYNANRLYRKVHHSVVDVDNCTVPYLATLNIKEKYSTKICSGAILDSKHILTVAQCLENALNVSVVVEVQKGTKIEKSILVKSWVKHPKYTNKPKIRHDIAVVTLERPMQFNKCISPISLPTPDYTRTSNVCMVSGWNMVKGNTYFGNLTTSYLEISPHKTCQKLIGQNCMRQFLCMNSSTQDQPAVCLSNLGGPLTCIEAVGGQAVLEGLASQLHCKSDTSFFVNVPEYSSWIMQQLGHK